MGFLNTQYELMLIDKLQNWTYDKETILNKELGKLKWNKM